MTFSFKDKTALQGILFKLLSCALFAGINGIVRYLSGGAAISPDVTLPASMMMFFQNLFGVFFLIPWLLKGQTFRNFKTQYPLLHLSRVLAAVLGVFFWYLTLKAMPLAEGVALTFTSPIFGVMLAWIFLKEKLDFTKTFAISLSLLGVFIISRPDIPLSGGEHKIGLLFLLPLASVIAFSADKILTRKLAHQGESPALLTLYLLVFMAPVSLIFAVFEWTMPTSEHWAWLVLLGALSAGANLCFSKAYKLAEVTFLTPVAFSKFFLSALVGYFAFEELPSSWSLWGGMGIIFLSILFLAYKIPLYSTANRLRSS